MKKFLAGLGKGKRPLTLIGFGIVAFIVVAILQTKLPDAAAAAILVASLVLIALGALGIVIKILTGVANGVKKVSKKLTGNKKAAKNYGNHSSSSKKSKGDDIVTLISKDGQEIDFLEIAGIAYKGSFYAILQPVELLDGMSSDEALVFKVTRGADGSDKFNIELDDDIIDAVFKEYDKLLAKARK